MIFVCFVAIWATSIPAGYLAGALYAEDVLGQRPDDLSPYAIAAAILPPIAGVMAIMTMLHGSAIASADDDQSGSDYQ